MRGGQPETETTARTKKAQLGETEPWVTAAGVWGQGSAGGTKSAKPGEID